MSYGAGHIQDMINRLKQNRAQRPSQRTKFKENTRKTLYASQTKREKKQHFKTVSKEQLSKAKREIRIRAKRYRMRSQRIYAIAIFVFIVLLLWLYYIL